ncbi:MAG: LamG-like jellyroll fold domain-containing protein [Akkermansiaceae bacterium]
MKRNKMKLLCVLLLSQLAHGKILFQDNFDGDGIETNTGVGGSLLTNDLRGSTWIDDGTASFSTSGTNFRNRALLYSDQSFTSSTGFKATFYFKTGNVGSSAAHNFSFGLVSTDTDLASYAGYNPFGVETSVYSTGINLIAYSNVIDQGMNFANGTDVFTLGQSGTNASFIANEVTKVTFEIGVGGYWSYRINDVYEASGVVLEGFDLEKSYRLVAYGQDDNGGGKELESILLETRYAQGERASNVRGTWSSGIPVSFIDDISDLKTLDALSISFTNGASASAYHFSPHKLLETLAEGAAVGNETPIVPAWGDFTLDRPENDALLEEALAIKAEGFKVKAYMNCENFVGNNGDADTLLSIVSQRWFDYCDTNSEVQAFINSQPFHTGIWNAASGEYEVAYNDDGTERFPNRKYLFCYAEYFLKDYAMRYAYLIDNWIFDAANTLTGNGDNATNGLIEDQRLFQAYANAVHAGNPEIALAFNNSRSNFRYFSYPYAQAVQFEDFTFGHAFGGNNDHGSKTGTQFNSNYNYIARMTETGGNVFKDDTDSKTWDDLIVGNYHSKLSTTAWKYGPNQAWEQADFNAWNLEAMQAGGAMTWDGSFNRAVTSLHGWVVPLLQGMDDHLAEFESPNTPNWARAYTVLPDAIVGEPYSHELVEGVDFWDPEGDEITAVWFYGQNPAWLSIAEDANNPGTYILSGTPNETAATEYTFNARARDEFSNNGTRTVELSVNNPLEYGLEAEWKFEEAAGYTVADSASGLHTATNATGEWTDGFLGGGMRYSGASTTTVLPASAFNESRLNEEITISMWVNGDSELSNRTTALQAYDIDGNRALNIHLPWTNDTVFWDAGNTDGAINRVTTTSPPATYSGGWNHWIFTKNANTGEMSIYHNGELLQTASGMTFELDTITEIALGNNPDGTSGFYGVIDEVRVYSTALSSYGAATLYNAYGAIEYEAWASSFGILETSHWYFDDDSDGTTNLLEYILDGDPEDPGVNILPEMVSSGSDVNFSFNRRVESTNDTVQMFQYSSDLVNWFEIPLTEEPLDSAVEITSGNNEIESVNISLRDSGLEDDDKKIFGRLMAYPIIKEGPSL